MSQYPQFPSDGYPFPLGDSSARSSTQPNGPGIPASQGVGMQGFGQYGAAPGQSRGAEGFVPGINASKDNHGLLPVAQGQGSGMMFNFLINSRADPWSTLTLGNRFRNDEPVRQQTSSFTIYRCDPPPSEAETTSQSVGAMVSDSGYATMPMQSIGSRSVLGDPDQSLDPGFLARVQAMGHGSIASNEEVRQREPQSQMPPPTVPTGKQLVCPDCGKELKTRSELKKHQARHSRPYKCDFQDCPKAVEGFSTSNDLDRHKRSKHKIFVGDPVVWRCSLGQCKNKPKDWDRQDNFKQHLRRRHKIEDADVSQYMHRLSNPYPSEPSVTTSTAPPSQAPCTGSDYIHVSPADIVTGEPRLGSASSVVTYQGQIAEETGSITSTAPTSAYPIGEPPASSHVLQDMDPVISDLRIPRLGASGTNPSGAQHASDVDPSACVSPDVLTRVPDPRSLAPPPVTQQEPLYVGRDAEARRDEVRSEAGRAVSTVAGEMEPDGGDQESASNDDEDSETEEPDGKDDIPIPRDASTELLGAGQLDVKEPNSPERSGDDAALRLDLLEDDAHASAVVESLLKKGKLSEILKKLGYTAPEEDPEAGDQKPSAVPSTAGDSSRKHTCEECNKSFLRLCELKKHRRRHTKPYACTFARCDQKFGSKSDWKRHENNQHVQLEIWRCDERLANLPEHPECGKVFHIRDNLKDHLRQFHKIHDPAALDRKLADYRMGRNFESRFWCGFCRRVIEPQNRAGPAHSERFDHIDAHFNGRGMPKSDIKDWKHIDTDVPNVPGPPPGQSQQDGSVDAGGPVRNRSSNDQHHRKRGHGEGLDREASRAKRHKDGGRRQYYWTCCNCGEIWDWLIVSQCLGNCGHHRCDNCQAQSVMVAEHTS